MARRNVKIDQTVGWRDVKDDDTPNAPTRRVPIAAWERIVSSMRIGGNYEAAIRAAGVSTASAYGWQHRAATLTARAATLGVDVADLPDLTDYDMLCVDFADGLQQAEAEWEVHNLGILENLGRGGITTTETRTRRNADGAIIETTEIIRTLPPNPESIFWRLARRFPDRYSPRTEVTGAGGAPLNPTTEADEQRILADELRAFLEGVEAAEARAAEAPPVATPRTRARATKPTGEA
jgi:hypothetical protein